MKHLDDIIKDVKEGRRVYGDKAYGFKENRDSLKAKNLKDGLMKKATRGKRLSNRGKIFNKLISKKRYMVEQSFGTLKRKFNGTTSCL